MRLALIALQVARRYVAAENADPYFEVREDGVSANEFVAPEMVCFCDIPVEKLAIHTSKYSRFGLAFSKAFLLTQGANPEHYVARNAATPLRLISPGGDDATSLPTRTKTGC